MSEDIFSFMLGFILFVVCPIAVCKEQNNKTRQIIDRRKFWLKKRVEYRVENNIDATQRYTYNTCEKDIDVDFIFDSKQKSVFVSKTSSFVQIPTDEIAGCETIIDNKSAGGIGRAIVGSVLAGGAGAIVGALTTKQKVHSFQLIIYRNNIENPKFIFTLIKKPADTMIENDANVKEATEFAQSVTACIRAIISQNEKNEVKKEGIKTPKSKNPASQLKSLKNLLQKGLISEEEYNNKREKILNDL